MINWTQILLKTLLSVILPLKYIDLDITEQCYAIKKKNDNVMAAAHDMPN